MDDVRYKPPRCEGSGTKAAPEPLEKQDMCPFCGKTLWLNLFDVANGFTSYTFPEHIGREEDAELRP
jgi:hypothetical protein